MAAAVLASHPYCGAPPVPAELWQRWNLDPVLLGALLGIALLYASGASQLWISRRERVSFYAGWAVAGLALVSPLCALSVSLFAARVGQHMVLVLIAAPLVVAGRPAAAILRALGVTGTAGAHAFAKPLWSAAAFALCMWFWHAPGPYDATFSSSTVYWSMHLSLFGAACWLWTGLLDATPARAMQTLAASLFSTVEMGFLGALITVSPRPLYAPHALTTAVWGLSQVQDQQIGGALMWIPGDLVFLAVSVRVLWSTFRSERWRTGKLAALASVR